MTGFGYNVLGFGSGSVPPFNATRAVFAGGAAYTDQMQYITIASTGNGTDFGNLTDGRYGMGAVSNGERGVLVITQQVILEVMLWII